MKFTKRICRLFEFLPFVFTLVKTCTRENMNCKIDIEIRQTEKTIGLKKVRANRPLCSFA